MAQKQGKRSNVAIILRGFKEVLRVTFTSKPIETDFTITKPDANTPKQEENPVDDKNHLRRINSQNELIIAPEYLQEMKDFIGTHQTPISVYTAPCYYNNDACELSLCVFPMVIRNPNEQPVVQSLVVMQIDYGKTTVAVADFNVSRANAVRDFEAHIKDLTPLYYQQDRAQTFENALHSLFPDLSAPPDPIFLEAELSGKETHNETI